MRAMRRSALRISFIALACTLGCGGSLADVSPEDRARDDEAMLARGQHEDVVRLAGDTEAPPLAEGECDGACPTLTRIRSLTERICRAADGDPHDEATRFLCEDARERRGRTERRVEACGCE